MATLNLGNIKFNWKGAYAGGTAYVVDDVVSYQGGSYICILASTGNLPTNGTYWETLAEGGDVATTLTTQGDILYRDGSGLQRLAAGTSGQVLTTGGAGANVSWQDGGGNTPYFYGAKASAQTLARGTITKITGLTQDERDSDTAFDGTTFTVPSGKGGIYYLQGVVTGQYGTAGNDGEQTNVYIYKNGSEIKQGSFYKNGSSANYADLSQAQVQCSIMTSLAAGDTIELYGRLVDFNNSAGGDVMAGQSHLMGFKIG